MENTPFPGAGDPFGGIAPNLVPHPPAAIPEPQSAGDAMASASPFKEALDVEAIIRNLTLDRPLKLFIPNLHKYPQFEFRIINSIPSEISAAHNKGFSEVTDTELAGLFTDLVAGTDKNGKAFRPILCARPKEVGEHIRRRQRMQLQSLYAGMDPTNKDLSGKYTDNVDNKGGTKGQFQGPAFSIKV